MAMVSEADRIAFLVQRDGAHEAERWVRRTLEIYRKASVSPSNHASRPEYRPLFELAIREYERWLAGRVHAGSGAGTDDTMTRFAQALIDPASVFGRPHDVLAASELSRAQKIELLRRWEYDVRELEVAEEENMPGPTPSILDEVLTALHALGGGVDTEHSPPTKQGGV